MDFSTAEWKVCIQDHERKMFVEAYEHKKKAEKEESEFLGSIKDSSKSELGDFIDSIEDSNKKSHDDTISLLNQIYTEYDTYKKEAMRQFYELNYTLSTTHKEAKQNIHNLNNTLEKVTQEKDGENANLTEKIRQLENLLTVEMDTTKELRQKLLETEETLETSVTELTEEIDKSGKLERKLEKLEDKAERLELKIRELNKTFGQCKDELKEAREVIENLKENQKQRTGPTADFFKGVRILNVPPFVCDGTQKSMVYLNVSEMVELESIGFLGPLNCDAIYEVMIQVNQMTPRGNKWKCIAQMLKKVTARRQQVFHVDFDEPLVLDDYATDERNSFTNSNGFYTIYYCLKGPNTESADILNGAESKEVTQEVDEVVFYTKWCHNQWAELGFQKC